MEAPYLTITEKGQFIISNTNHDSNKNCDEIFYSKINFAYLQLSIAHNKFTPIIVITQVKNHKILDYTGIKDIQVVPYNNESDCQEITYLSAFKMK